jgi:hypothetical protein
MCVGKFKSLLFTVNSKQLLNEAVEWLNVNGGWAGRPAISDKNNR